MRLILVSTRSTYYYPGHWIQAFLHIMYAQSPLPGEHSGLNTEYLLKIVQVIPVMAVMGTVLLCCCFFVSRPLDNNNK